MGLIYADLELFNSDDLALQRRGYLQSDFAQTGRTIGGDG